jgi:hypothetical protein
MVVNITVRRPGPEHTLAAALINQIAEIDRKKRRHARRAGKDGDLRLHPFTSRRVFARP